MVKRKSHLNGAKPQALSILCFLVGACASAPSKTLPILSSPTSAAKKDSQQREGLPQPSSRVREKTPQKFSEPAIHLDPQKTLSAILSSTASSPERPEAKRSIGILLPLSGRFSRMGTRALQAIQMVFQPSPLPSIASSSELASELAIDKGRSPESREKNSIHIAIEDSGETPEQTLQAFEKLVVQHQAAAIIGPLLSKGYIQIATQAQHWGVPLLSLTRASLEVPLDYVFQVGLTEKAELETLTTYVIAQQQKKRFAILAPQTSLGQELANTFWDLVEQKGGQVVGFASYPADQTDFKKYIDALTGGLYPELRKEEWDQLERERQEKGVLKHTHKNHDLFRLKPIIDFEAVFIADGIKAAGQILPTFAYRDVTSLPFLGLSLWNHPEFLERNQGYAEGATLVDLFLTDTNLEELPENVRTWIKRYEATYHQKPSSFEAVAYDVALLLKELLGATAFPGKPRPTGGVSRTWLKEQLQQVSSFAGMTGIFRFHEGALRPELKIFSVQQDRWRLQPAAPTEKKNSAGG